MKKLLFATIALMLLLSACSQKRDFSEEYNADTDNQYFYNNRDVGFAQDESNYYFMEPHSFYICAKPKNKGEAVVLCNKPDCLHDKETDQLKTSLCNALIMQPIGNIQYYDNKLYISSNLDYKLQGSSLTNIYEFSTDGSGFKEIIKPNKYVAAFVVHRGYLYAAFTDFTSGSDNYTAEQIKDKSFYIAEYNLSKLSAKPKIIYQKAGCWGQITRINAKGEYLYFDGLYKPEITSEYEGITGSIKLSSMELVQRSDLHSGLAFTDNKVLSTSEDIKQLKAYEDYIYNNERAKNESLPARLMLNNSSGTEQAYYVFPDSEMSDNQLLQYAQLSFSDYIPDAPSKEELQYNEVKALSSQFLADYGFEHEEIEATYVLYSKQREPFTEGLWHAFISTKVGHDYQVVIYAKSRLPYMINRCAQDKYSLHKTAEEIPAAKELSDEKLLAKAQEYFNTYGLAATKATVGSSTIATGSPSNGHAYYRSVAFNTDSLFVQMNIDMSDLSLCGITITLI